MLLFAVNVAPGEDGESKEKDCDLSFFFRSLRFFLERDI